MMTQPASAGVQLLGALFCFIGGGLLLDGILGHLSAEGPTTAWGWCALWLPLGIGLVIRGGRGQRARIAMRDAQRSARVQVLAPAADIGARPDDETRPGVIQRPSRE